MADYASRIASLKAEQSRLAQRQSELAAQRREEIGSLADRLGILETEGHQVKLARSDIASPQAWTTLARTVTPGRMSQCSTMSHSK
jgi:hypothetical protein